MHPLTNYGLLYLNKAQAVSNAHIFAIPLFCLLKEIEIVDNSKSYMITVWMNVSLEVLKYILFLQQKKFSLFASLCQTDFKLEKLVTFFPEILTRVTVGLIEKIVLFTEKCWFMTWICFIWKPKEYTNDHRPNTPTI